MDFIIPKLEDSQALDLISLNCCCLSFSWFTSSTVVDEVDEEAVVDSEASPFSKLIFSSLYLNSNLIFSKFQNKLKKKQNKNQSIKSKILLIKIQKKREEIID